MKTLYAARAPNTFLPDPARTLHLIGDIHVGLINQTRRDTVLGDVVTLFTPYRHMQIGDQTDNGTAAQDTIARAWLDRLPAAWYATLGNHDIDNNVRTPAQWAVAYGMPGQNYTVDLGFVQLIVVAPDSLTTVGVKETELSAATVTYLDTQLAAASKDCWICCHAPLKNTALSSASAYGSDESFFYSYVDADIRAVLAARSRAKAWISGHTHSPITASGFVKLETVGGRTIACINCSSIYYTDRNDHSVGSMATLYLTSVAGGIEIRARDHGLAQWVAIGGAFVTTVATP